jgi:predicted dehydrogenase
MTTNHITHPQRVGIVGLGWAGETHLKAYKQQPQVEVLALAGLETPRLNHLGSTYNVPHLYENYEDLIARDDLDIVSVCVPNYLHAPIAIAALRSGKHVLCEKPLARSGAEAQTIVDAATQANRVVHVAFNHRRRGDVQVLKRHIEGGSLGRLYHAKASWMRRSGIPGLGSWFTNKEMAGGGPLIDLGVHVLDMALYLLGEPTVRSVSAATYAELGPRNTGGMTQSDKQQVGSPFEVEDLATAFLRLEGGGTLLLESSCPDQRSQLHHGKHAADLHRCCRRARRSQPAGAARRRARGRCARVRGRDPQWRLGGACWSRRVTACADHRRLLPIRAGRPRSGDRRAYVGGIIGHHRLKAISL